MTNIRAFFRLPLLAFRLCFCAAGISAVAGNSALAAPIGPSVQQLILSVAPSWDAPGGALQLFERDGRGWKASGAPWPVLYGRNGLAWGRGVLGTDEPGLHKTERDKRAPAGV